MRCDTRDTALVSHRIARIEAESRATRCRQGVVQRRGIGVIVLRLVTQDIVGRHRCEPRMALVLLCIDGVLSP